MFRTRTEWRVYLKDIQDVLNNENTQSSGFEFTNCLKRLQHLVKNRNERHDTLFKEYFPIIIKTIVQTITVERISIKENVDVIEDVFLCSDPAIVIPVLTLCIEECKPGLQQSKCISLLEKILSADGIASIIWNESSPKSMEEQQFSWNNLINVITSLPDKMANKLKSEMSDIFFPKNYVPLVVENIHQTLKKFHKKLKEKEDVSVEFVSVLVGKLCIMGYSELFWTSILPYLIPEMKTDFIWCRLCERMTTGVPERSLEATLAQLLMQLPWFGWVEKFLGNSVLKNQKIKYLICTKLLLLRHSQHILQLQNILGYLYSCHTRKHLFLNSFKELLTVWGDSSALRHTSIEQHVYITKALFIGMGFLPGLIQDVNNEELLHLLMPGVQNHLGNSDPRTRKLGMALAEQLTLIISPAKESLKFDLEKDDEIKDLLKLSVPPIDPEMENMKNKVESIDIRPNKTLKETKPLLNKETQAPIVDPDLDSDDDLLPYDMSEDTKVMKVKPPKYIRECMEGLISSDEPERLEVCLNAAEPLIRKKLQGLEEIAEEFAKILIHLSDKYTTPQFTSLRYKTLVALTVIAPVQVAPYLTKEFYERNYNLRQRLDILEVLGAAAQELSQPNPANETKDSTHNNQSMKVYNTQKTSQEGWRDVIQKRIERKTRRFGKAGGRSGPIAVLNKYGAVCGHFFYPLMVNFDRKENSFDLMGEDSLVLARLLYTLGVVIYSAINTQGVKDMGKRLLEFLWVLRFHFDQSVKQAILFAVSMIFLSVPGHYLLSDLQPEVLEMKQWLEEVVEKDSNAESKSLAIQCLVIMENVIKQEYTKDSVNGGLQY